MRPADVSRLDDERRGNDWTAQTTNRTVDDVDADALLRARSLLRSAPDETRRKLSDMSAIDLLRALKVVGDIGQPPDEGR